VPKDSSEFMLAQHSNVLIGSGAPRISHISKEAKPRIMKSVTNIAVLLMAMTASEASRLGSPSEVSGDSSFVGRRMDLMSCRTVVAVLFQPSPRSSIFLPTPDAATNTSNTPYVFVCRQLPRTSEVSKGS
jgi:hypothetical protein